MKKDTFTPKQEAFLEALFLKEVRGDVRKAMDLAGYSPNTRERDIVEPLREEISKRSHAYLEKVGVKAIFAMEDVLGEKPVLGAREKIVAAKDLMDRAGLKKTQTVEVDAESPIFIIPAKKAE